MPKVMTAPSPLRDAAKNTKRKGPVWRGPEEDGITFSLLSKFLVCRERFRLLVVEGLKPAERFNHRTGYGDLWHCAEEAFAAGKAWQLALNEHCQKLVTKYPMQQKDIERWFLICQMQFPIYIDHWSKHPDVQARTPLLQEQAFSVPYRLPSGRTVRLRGKWDSVDLIGKGKSAGIYLQENKTKGNPDERQIKQQLTFDLQTMIYLVALKFGRESKPSNGHIWAKHPISGVRYNVIKRPLGGGKGTIKQKEATDGAKCPKCKNDDEAKRFCEKCGGAGRIGAKPAETDDEFLDRLKAYIVAEPETFFMRWRVEVSTDDVLRFQRECLDPILEDLCNWWGWVSTREKASPWGCPGHFRMPFGVYSPLLDARAGESEMDEHLITGSRLGLQTVDNLFPELT